MNKKIIWPIINSIAFIAVITVNALANILPFNGISTGELSDSYPNLFVPAGITFSIWSVIYLLLAALIVYQFITPKKSEIQSQFPASLNPFLLINFTANALWMIAWHWKILWLSLICMLTLLGTLIVLFLKLDPEKGSRIHRFLVKTPISVYLGWITVATIANITAILVNSGWKGFGISEILWTQIMIYAALIIGIIMIYSRKNIAYTLVLIWSFLGIFIKRNSTGIPEEKGIVSASSAAVLILVVVLLITLFTARKTSDHHTS